MLPETKYTASRWHNRVQQKPSCNGCQPAGIEQRFQCAVCRNYFQSPNTRKSSGAIVFNKRLAAKVVVIQSAPIHIAGL
eukprot:7708260-Karenia_brevis.AAC.1